jgi:carbamoyl-phosphate synthase large subunit
VRPSYVLGGRAMEIVYNEEQLRQYATHAVQASPQHPILVDRFLQDAIEVDVDVLGDGQSYVIGGILEHIEEAGAHSGDSAMSLPPYSLSADVIERVREASYALARALKIIGLMNIQYAIRKGEVFVLEVNPRASRTIPFISKAIGLPLAKLAAQVMVGKTLQDLKCTEEIVPKHVSVKESVFPFARFPGVDILLGPEMRSTGEVMGIDIDFGRAYLKSQLAAGQNLPTTGRVFISVRTEDRQAIVPIAQRVQALGLDVVATAGTADALRQHGLHVETVRKIYEGRPNVLDAIKNQTIQWVINTPTGHDRRADEVQIRSLATAYGIPCVTTLPGAEASMCGLEAWMQRQLGVQSIQHYHEQVALTGVSTYGQ